MSPGRGDAARPSGGRVETTTAGPDGTGRGAERPDTRVYLSAITSVSLERLNSR